MRRYYWLLYPLWIAVCALLFVALRNQEDPSRRRDRVQSNAAAVRAVAILQKTDSTKYRRYEAVHVAWASAGEAGSVNRWVVLCDSVPHTSLRDAVVVEIDGRDGGLLSIRRPQ